MTQDKDILKIGIVAGEHSGDLLGYELLKELTKTSNIKLYGVGGPKIESLGLSSVFNFKNLQIMGLIDPLINYKKLTKGRKKLIQVFIDNEIDIFIGVDSPDFNIGIHKALNKKKLCKNIQLVSPSVWGWRQNRIKSIKKYIDHTICLFNFEHEFYSNKGLSSSHLGHPFSELNVERRDYVIEKYSLEEKRSYISILPGSRESEINHMMPIYKDYMELQLKSNTDSFFLIPTSDSSSQENIEKHLNSSHLPFLIKQNSVRDFLSISDKSVVTSGTASLEAAVLNANPIICYKTSFLNYAIISRMLKIDFIGLPNLLLKKERFPELIQRDCTSESILNTIENYQAGQYSDDLKLLLKGDGFEVTALKILDLN